jgi:pimeloyl-ACP methyl ester carboxylesterase
MLHFHESLTTQDSTARTITLDTEITGVLWHQPVASRPRPLILIAHGGGQSSHAPNVRALAEMLAERGYDAVALDAPGHGGRSRSSVEEKLIAEMRSAQGDPETVAGAVAALNDELTRRAVPEWMQLLDELEHAGLRENRGSAGYWGLSLGAAIGFALLSTETRIQAAVLGLAGDNLAELARTITAPIQFILQWDDEIIARDSALRLYDAIGSEDKTLHANPGKHGEVPSHEHTDALIFFDRQLMCID